MTNKRTSRYRNIVAYVILALLSISVSQSYGQTTPAIKNIERDIKHADRLFDREVYGKSYIRYEKLLQKDLAPWMLQNQNWKEHIELRKLLAGFYLNPDLHVDQLAAYIESHRENPSASEAAVKLGNYYFNKKKWRKSLTYFDLVQLNNLNAEANAEVRFKKGYIHFVGKRFQQAEEEFSFSRKIESKYYYPSAYYSGISLFYLDKKEQAEKQFIVAEESKKYKNIVPYYLTQIYFDNKDYDKVISYGEAKIKKDIQERDEIKKLIGNAYYEKGDYTKSLNILEQVLGSKKKKLSTVEEYQIGFLKYQQGKYEEAYPHLKKATILDNEMGQLANYYLAQCFIKLNKKEDARIAFSNVQRKNYNENIIEESAYNYGLLSAELKYDREAINAFLKIKESSKYYDDAQSKLGKVLLNTKDFNHAITVLEKQQLNNNNLKEAYQKATFQKALQSYNSGEFLVTKANLDKSDVYPINQKYVSEGQLIRAEIDYHQKNYAASNQKINSYLSQNSAPQDALPALYTKGYNHLKQKQYQQAAESFDRAIHIAENQTGTGALGHGLKPDLYVRYGDCAFKTNQYNKAEKAYRKVYDSGRGENIYALYQLAMIKGLQNDDAGKIALLKQLTTKHSNHQLADDALLQTSETYLKLGQFDLAVSPLNKIIQDYPNSNLITKVYLQKGLIAFNKGDNQTAIGAFEKVFKTNPTAEEKKIALRALEEIYVKDMGKADSYLDIAEKVTGSKIDNVDKDSITYHTAYNKYQNAEYDKAEKLFSSYQKKYPKGLFLDASHYYRGECLALSEKYKEAYKEYNTITGKKNSFYSQKARQKSALIAFHDMQDYAKAYQHYSDWAQYEKDKDLLHEARMGALKSAYHIQKDDEVLKYYKLLNQDTSSSKIEQNIIHYYAAKVYIKQGKKDESLHSLNYLSKNTNDERAAEARYEIARIYYDHNELNVAEDMARTAIQENVNYPKWVGKSLLLISDIFVAKKDNFNAKAALEALIENYKEDKDIVKEAQEKLAIIKAKEKAEVKKNSNSDDGKYVDFND